MASRHLYEVSCTKAHIYDFSVWSRAIIISPGTRSGNLAPLGHSSSREELSKHLPPHPPPLAGEYWDTLTYTVIWCLDGDCHIERVFHWLTVCLINRQTSSECPASGGVSSSQRTVYEAICGKTGGSDPPLTHMPTLLQPCYCGSPRVSRRCCCASVCDCIQAWWKFPAVTD